MSSSRRWIHAAARRSSAPDSFCCRRVAAASSSGAPDERGEIEHVLGALADGHDLRGQQVDALFHEHLAHVAQQAGPVARDQFEHRAPVALVDGDRDLRGGAEHARLARHAPRDRDRRVLGMLQGAPQRALDFADALAVGDGRAVFLEHVVEIEAEAVAGGRDARVDDVEARAGRAPRW